MLPEVVLADTLYGSDDNTRKANEMDVDIVSPVMGGSKESPLQHVNYSDKDLRISERRLLKNPRSLRINIDTAPELKRQCRNTTGEQGLNKGFEV